jgi:hypothetical protein
MRRTSLAVLTLLGVTTGLTLDPVEDQQLAEYTPPAYLKYGYADAEEDAEEEQESDSDSDDSDSDSDGEGLAELDDFDPDVLAELDLDSMTEEE